MKARISVAALAAVVVGALVAGTSAAAKGSRAKAGLDTSRPSQLVPLARGVAVDPLLSTGDVLGGYQMSGIPDGLGAYTLRHGRPAAVKHDNGRGSTVEVTMNHELDGTKPAGVGARVSRVSLDPQTLRVLNARYLMDGTEGFVRFCSATLQLIDGRALHFTGEESTGSGALTSDPNDGLGRGGSSVAVDVQTGRWRETRHFGLFAHENVAPVKGLGAAVIVSPEDGDPGKNESQLYAYVAPTFEQALAGTGGSLRVFKADAPGDGNPSANDIAEGQTLSGRFVAVSQAENADANTLEAAAQAKQAFDFVRLEDVAQSKTDPRRLYLTDTGRTGTETVRGRLYRVDIDPSDPTRASITHLLDGDAQAARGDSVQLVNPDNIDTSDGSVVIQEDRNSEHRDAPVQGGYGRILVYDIASRSLKAVARVNTPPNLRPGEWESSGVLNAAALLGRDEWLVDVQAHDQTAPQPGPSLAPNSALGEDGQLLHIRIPGS